MRTAKIFEDTAAGFMELPEDTVDELLMGIAEKVDVMRMSELMAKNSDIMLNIVTNFNYNSYGHKAFTKILFFFLQKPFDLKIKK